MADRRIVCVAPSRVGVGEPFSVKVRLVGPSRPVPWACFSWNMGVRYAGPFNGNARGFRYLDDVLEEWSGTLLIEDRRDLDGPARLVFDGSRQGVFPGDRRPIATFDGFRWTAPGIHLLTLRDPASGTTAVSNPVLVTENPPERRLYWGDPHWQTIFSDGLRCPEELYAFARDEAFLDFGAISDHVEAATDLQWEYMVAAANLFNEPGRFATLVGFEWTKHAPGHRNVYFRGDTGPVLRSNDPRYDTLEKLWRGLEGLAAIAVPHHPANVTMGVDWELGWNPALEKAVEVYSCWGSSERPGTAGNVWPIRHCGGEKPGRYVLDALRKGYRFGFVGGGDVHDGRPGAGPLLDHDVANEIYPFGLTAAELPELRREAVFDAVADRRTYCATQGRPLAELVRERPDRLRVRAAASAPLVELDIVRNGTATPVPVGGTDPRVVETEIAIRPLEPGEFCYLRLRSAANDGAWTSPIYG